MTVPSEEPLVLRAAHAYIERGYPVFPLIGKVPTKGSNGLNDATTDRGQIDAWFAGGRYTNLGIAIPDGVKILDVDVQHHGDDIYNAWMHDHGVEWLEHAPRQRTGNGGVHLVFRDEHDLAYMTPNAPGCEMRRKGHYIVVAPSIHPDTNTQYRWEIKLGPLNQFDVPLPEWMWDVWKPLAPTAPTATISYIAGADPIDNAAHDYTSWAQLLSKHGWALLPHTGDGNSDGSIWKHPTATARSSASIKHGCLFVYSPTPGLPTTSVGDPNGITMFNGIKYLDFNNDKNATFSALRDAGYLAKFDVTDLTKWITEQEDAEHVVLPLDNFRVDWAAMWATELEEEDRWILEPLFARGRAHALYARAKDGKSLLVLEALAALATGRRFLDRPTEKPITVLYADYEMTEDDLRERLESFGYSDDDDLSHLHYLLMPSMLPLDVRQAGDLLVEHAQGIEAEFVVIDTTGRATQGEESDNDTIRNFYRWTGSPLKRAGIGWCRIDHEGKEAAKGQRGASAKNDDVDIVWKLAAGAETRNKDGVVSVPISVNATYSRLSWVPKGLNLSREERPDGTTTHAGGTGGLRKIPPGTADCISDLYALGVPFDIGVNEATKLLKHAQKGRHKRVVSAAVRERKDRAARLAWVNEQAEPPREPPPKNQPEKPPSEPGSEND